MNLAMDRLIIVVVFLSGSAPIMAYPDGPPLSACRDMQPRTQMGELGLEGHTEPAQSQEPTQDRSATPPYRIHMQPSPQHYEPNAVYNVYVTADQTQGGNVYMGLLMQARKITCYGNGTIGVEEDAIGHFTLHANTLLQTLDCNDVTDSAVAHKSRQWKTNETAQWHAPAEYVGHLAFWATIVQMDTVYWMGAHSAIMLDPNQPAPLPCSAPVTAHANTILLISSITITTWLLIRERYV